MVRAVGLPPGARGIACRGLIDLQVNGFAGVDVLSADLAALRAMTRALTRTGVTAFLATVISAPERDSLVALERIAAIRHHPERGAARVLGAHVEGPFLSPAFPGAHPLECLRTDAARLRWLAALPAVAMVTLAPEILDDPTAISDLVAMGRTVSIGHTDASAEQCHRAFDQGASALTHAFNAHRPIRSREAGPLGAAVVRDDVTLTAISDGVHVADDNLRLLDQAARGRIALVTDAMVAAGLGDGSYRYGPLDVTVEGGRARLADGTLAGSVATLDGCVRHAAALWGPEAALAAATTTPAALIGRPDLAMLAEGAAADIVVFDDDLEVEKTLVAGRTAWHRPTGQLRRS